MNSENETEPQNDAAASGVDVDALVSRLRPSQGIIGIDPGLHVYEGYDGSIRGANNGIGEWELDSLHDDEILTPGEKRTLANEMIRRWSAYRDAITD